MFYSIWYKIVVSTVVSRSASLLKKNSHYLEEICIAVIGKGCGILTWCSLKSSLNQNEQLNTTETSQIQLSSWVLPVAVSLVDLQRQPSQLSQCRRRNTHKPTTPAIVHATMTISHWIIAYLSWHFYWFWSFILFGNCNGGRWDLQATTCVHREP